MEAEFVGNGSRRASGGRRIAGDGERARLLEAYDASGLTQRAFAEREGVAYGTFVSWLKQRRQRRRGGIAPAGAVFHEVTMPPSPPAPLEVFLPDGMVVRGYDAASIATLIKALGC